MSYQVKVICTNCGHKGFLDIADGDLIVNQHCEVCLCQTLTRDTDMEGYRLLPPANQLLEGTIIGATWERSIARGDPYIKLVISSKEEPPHIYYKPYAIITHLLPGMIDNLSYLKMILRTEIKVPKKLKEGKTIPELIDKEVMMEVEYIEWTFKKFRPRIKSLQEVKK